MRKGREALGMQPLPEVFLCDPRLPMALPGISWHFLFHPYVLDGCVKDFRLPMALWSLLTMMRTTSGSDLS